MVPRCSSTKVVQTLLVGSISRSRGQNIGFQNAIFKNLLVWNYKAQTFYIWYMYIASSRGPVPNYALGVKCNLAPERATFYCVRFFSCFPVDSNVKHCVISYILPLITKIFSRSARWNTVLMLNNITRAVTTAFNALRNAVVWSNLRKLYYYIV